MPATHRATIEPLAEGIDRVRSRLTASVARPGRFGLFADRLARLFATSLADAEAALTAMPPPSAWPDGVVEGTRYLPLAAVVAHVKTPTLGEETEPVRRGFLWLRPHTHFPRHTHGGVEAVLVLTGAFRESDGSEAHRGDVREQPAGSTHELDVIGGEECIVAIVTRGDVEFG